MLNDDVAILAYKVEEQLTVDGKPVTVLAAEFFDLGAPWRQLALRAAHRVAHRRSIWARPNQAEGLGP